MEELVDIVDEKNELTGEIMTRQEAHRVGALHRSAHILIYNSKGEILLQLRSKNKKSHPNTWDVSAAGHVEEGENPIVTALREMKEEIGLLADESALEFWSVQRESKIFGNIKDNEFVYVYLLKHDELLDTFALQTSEVQEIKFIPVNEAEQELRQNANYLPHVYWSEIFEKVRQKLGLSV